MSEIKLLERFKSGNDIPVDSVRVTESEVREAIRQAEDAALERAAKACEDFDYICLKAEVTCAEEIAKHLRSLKSKKD